MSSDEKIKKSSNTDSNTEIQIENKDLLNVFFDKSSSQFESQFFLSRKRVLSAENGQSELSDLLKSKLKALDMMLLILSNNKNILKEADLSCCEVMNNLLSLSKKDKVYGEQIFNKVKNIMIYLIKNQILMEEKNIESQKVLIKFLINILNIKFDNGYFKQILDLITENNTIYEIFLEEFFHKIFKGRNITIKIKEMKYIIKSLLLNEKSIKYMSYFNLMERILNFAKDKNAGGCRTSFQINQVVFLLQYMVDICSINEIKKNLDLKNNDKKVKKILELFFSSINDMINKDDYDFDINKINKKNLEIKNENIKRKKIFFSEMMNFLNKLKKNFGEIINEKENENKIEEINNLYKSIINKKYVIVVNTNDSIMNKDASDKKKKNNEIKEKQNKKDEINEESNEDREQNGEKEDLNDKNKNDENNEEEEEEKKIIDKDDKVDKKEEKDDKEDETKEIELEEEPKQKKENKNKKAKKEKKKEDKKVDKKKDTKEGKKEKKNKDKIEKDEENNNIEMKNKKTKRTKSKDNAEEKNENKNKKKKKY